jgi:hypothetical protein
MMAKLQFPGFMRFLGRAGRHSQRQPKVDGWDQGAARTEEFSRVMQEVRRSILRKLIKEFEKVDPGSPGTKVMKIENC